LRVMEQFGVKGFRIDAHAIHDWRGAQCGVICLAHPTRQLDGGRGDLAIGLGDAYLSLAHQRGEGRGPGPDTRRAAVDVALQHRLGVGRFAERERELAHSLARGGTPEVELGAFDRASFSQPERSLVRLERSFEQPGSLARLTECGPQCAHPVGRCARETPFCVDDPLVLNCGIDVGVGAHRALSSHEPERARALVVSGLRVVQRQDRRVGTEVGGDALDRLARFAMEPGAEVVAEAVVGDVAHEAVAEPKTVGAVLLEKAREPIDRRRIDPKLLRTAFVTHLHSDHTAGYPDLIFTPAVLERQSLSTTPREHDEPHT